MWVEAPADSSYGGGMEVDGRAADGRVSTFEPRTRVLTRWEAEPAQNVGRIGVYPGLIPRFVHSGSPQSCKELDVTDQPAPTWPHRDGVPPLPDGPPVRSDLPRPPADAGHDVRYRRPGAGSGPAWPERDRPAPTVPRPPTAVAAPPARSLVKPWLVAGLVTLTVSASSFWFGRQSAPFSDPAALAPIATTATTEAATASPPTTEASPTFVAPEPRTPIIVEGDTSEPAAAVAAAVGPAVVQLELQGGLGSGVIYDAEGYILTAAHVVQGASQINVRLANGIELAGTVVGAHVPTDVAVVKIPASPDLPVAALGLDVEPIVGQTAIALGSPFGLDQTVTAGIVSALNREVNGVGMIQTDAAINPGNSGGPLVDRNGRVIGINDAIRTLSGANDGVGFAIPIDLAYIVAQQLVAGEEVRLARLGVSTTPFTDGAVGALVGEVVPGSAAEDAGLLPGDLITAVNGKPITDNFDLRAEILSEYPGTEIELTVIRDGQELRLPATLGAAAFSG